jgi:hypothetical protein
VACVGNHNAGVLESPEIHQAKELFLEFLQAVALFCGDQDGGERKTGAGDDFIMKFPCKDGINIGFIDQDDQVLVATDAFGNLL